MEYWKPGVESWRVSCELPQLDINEELLQVIDLDNSHVSPGNLSQDDRI